jgi:hypothetical protein
MSAPRPRVTLASLRREAEEALARSRQLRKDAAHRDVMAELTREATEAAARAHHLCDFAGTGDPEVFHILSLEQQAEAERIGAVRVRQNIEMGLGHKKSSGVNDANANDRPRRTHDERDDFAVVLALTDDVPDLDAKKGDDLFLYLRGDMLLSRALSASEVAALMLAEPALPQAMQRTGRAILRCDIAGTDARSGDSIQHDDGGVYLLRRHKSAESRRAAWRVLRSYAGRLGCNVLASKAKADIEAIRKEWEERYSPLRVVDAPPKRRRPGAARGAAHPYYRTHAVPALRVISGGAR